jgi:hypothetical protein
MSITTNNYSRRKENHPIKKICDHNLPKIDYHEINSKINRLESFIGGPLNSLRESDIELLYNDYI